MRVEHGCIFGDPLGNTGGASRFIKEVSINCPQCNAQFETDTNAKAIMALASEVYRLGERIKKSEDSCLK